VARKMFWKGKVEQVSFLRQRQSCTNKSERNVVDPVRLGNKDPNTAGQLEHFVGPGENNGFYTYCLSTNNKSHVHSLPRSLNDIQDEILMEEV